MPWMAPGEPRLPRMVVTLLGMVVFLHLMFMLRDGQREWRESRAYLVAADGSTARTGAPSDATAAAAAASPSHPPQRGQSILSFIPTPPSVADVAALPLPPPHPFPRKIWQTGRNGAGSLDEETTATVSTWTKLNQDWRYEILTDASAETYVRTSFADRPEIVSTYLALRDPILRADMLRYLILLGDGGVYSDMDTRALKPIDDWIPMEHRGHVSVVVGIEYDSMGIGRWMDWTLDLQFTNWAMLAQPSHPLLELTVQKVIYALNVLAAKKGLTLADIRPDYHEVLDTTGPALFSLAIFEWLTVSTGQEFSWQNCTKLREPLLVNDILILPVTSFGNSQPHSESGPAEHQNALVQHMFRGSWKDAHPMTLDEPQPPHESQAEGGEGEGGEGREGGQEPQSSEDPSSPSDDDASASASAGQTARATSPSAEPISHPATADNGADRSPSLAAAATAAELAKEDVQPVQDSEDP